MFSFILYNKKNLFLVIGLLALIFILFFISIFSSQETGPIPNPSPSVNPFLFPGSSTKTPLNNLPESRAVPSSSPLPAYKPEELDKDYQRIISRKPLLQNDQTIRQSLIGKLNNQSGILDQTSNYKIEYVKAPDVFMIELDSISPDIAKAEATGWFKQQGVTTEGVCNLPVVFYLSSEINNYFSQSGLQFNPIPEGCEQ